MKAIRPETIETILIRGTNWVGDAVMSIPAMREIRRIFDRAHISLLVRPWVQDVYSAVDFVDEVIPYDRESEYRGWNGVRRAASRLALRRFDLAILLQNAFEAALLTWLARIPQRLGYARDGRGFLLTHGVPIDRHIRSVHQCFYYLDILSGAGLLPPEMWRRPDYRPSIRIGVRDSDTKAARQMLRDAGIEPGEILVGINPGAFYGGAKRWLSERYAEVADALSTEYGARIAIFGAGEETRIAHEVAGYMRHKPVVLAGRTTLGNLMGLLAQCSLLITNDSGPMHLAAALGTAQLAIFGSTSEIATGPLSPRAEVIKHPVDCSPCFLRECPIDFRCMKSVTAERVVAAARMKLDERQNCGN
jgi:heptosyltransferase-2